MKDSIYSKPYPEDNCTAVGHGLMLRAEEMDRRVWWWAVLDNNGSRVQWVIYERSLQEAGDL